MNIADILSLERPLISLDLETTGIHVKVDRVIQIGIVKVKPNGEVTEWKTFINPGMPIPKEAIAAHGITDDMIKDAPKFETIARVLLAGLTDCDLAGYNIRFDLGFLSKEFGLLGMKFTPGKVIDGFRIFQREEPRNLVAASMFYLGEPFPTAHDALEDARRTLRVIEAQLIRYTHLPKTISAIHELFNETISENQVEASGKLVWRNGEAALNFGKHAGTLLKETPRSYLVWMSTGDFTDEVQKIARNALLGQFPKNT
jgi:DNA polymerase-3 subunit epsilon